MTDGATNKLARICWNANGWTKPSGREGKSRNKQTSEAQIGFGYEEWLFDVDKIIDGYHYGWIEGADKSKGRRKYLKNLLDIGIYSINCDTGNRYRIGEINDVEIVSYEESTAIWEIYKSNGWLDEMADQIKAVGGNVKEFWKLWQRAKTNLADVKFKPENLSLLKQPKLIPRSHRIYKLDRYRLYSAEKDSFLTLK